MWEGNISFGIIAPQFTTPSATPHMSINGDEFPLQYQPLYYNNIEFLCRPDNAHLCAVLLAMGHSTGGMVSWDAAKYACNPVPVPRATHNGKRIALTRPGLTPPHCDSYDRTDSTTAQRVQAVLEWAPEVKLGFVPFSHLPHIRELLERVMEKPGLYSRSGKCLVAQAVIC